MGAEEVQRSDPRISQVPQPLSLPQRPHLCQGRIYHPHRIAVRPMPSVQWAFDKHE